MNFSIKKELPLILVALMPFLYLAYIWQELPAKVPMHWNIDGEVDRYGDKIELIIIPFLLPVMIYLIFLIIPKIDPKNKLDQMGSKYQSLKTLLTIFMSVLALFIIFSAKSQSLNNLNYTYLLIGILYLILGNYFKTIKANYFIGIRTPWTLENETVWSDTHKMAGVLWFVAGIIVILLSLILEKRTNFFVFIAITFVITIIPVSYSYLRFRRLRNQEAE